MPIKRLMEMLNNVCWALVTLPPSNYEGAEFRVAYENEDSNYAQVGSHISITQTIFRCTF